MSRNMISRLPRHFSRAARLSAVGAPAFVMAATTVTSAFAQSVSGAIDPATGLGNLAPYFLTLVAAASVLITAWKGTHAVAEGRSLAPAVGGLVGGLALAFGGYYVMSKYGVSAQG